VRARGEQWADERADAKAGMRAALWVGQRAYSSSGSVVVGDSRGAPWVVLKAAYWADPSVYARAGSMDVLKAARSVGQ
jgi:hypothetical protein